jgi:hypothetical protein
MDEQLGSKSFDIMQRAVLVVLRADVQMPTALTCAPQA